MVTTIAEGKRIREIVESTHFSLPLKSAVLAYLFHERGYWQYHSWNPQGTFCSTCRTRRYKTNMWFSKHLQSKAHIAKTYHIRINRLNKAINLVLVVDALTGG